MERAHVLAELHGYVGREILDGHDIGLDARTPLLEWGIINSFEIMRVIAFIAERFGVLVPPERIVTQHFATLDNLTELVVTLAAAHAPPARETDA